MKTLIKLIKATAMRQGFDVVSQRNTGLYSIRLNYEEYPFAYDVPLVDVLTTIDNKLYNQDKETILGINS